MDKDWDARGPGEYSEQAHKFWSIYVSEAEQHDSNITETWKGDMDSTLIFAGLFSATVTAFILESYKLLKQDSGEVTVALLTQILAIQIATATPTNMSSIPVAAAIPDADFRPSTSAIVVNVLWFLSLACSLAAALCVTLIQQWVRDYLQRVQRHSQPLRRARVRAFLFSGSEEWKMDAVVQNIPTLLHSSLFLFFSGLCVFLSPISLPVTVFVVVMTLCCLALYGLATLAPLWDPATPYETSISSIFWWMTHRPTSLNQPPTSDNANLNIKSPCLDDAREQSAMHPSNPHELVRFDAQALLWTYKRMSDDSEFQSFLGSIPGLLRSVHGETIWNAVFFVKSYLWSEFEDRTIQLYSSCWTSGYMEPVLRQRRANICLDALLAVMLRMEAQDNDTWLFHMRRRVRNGEKPNLYTLVAPPFNFSAALWVGERSVISKTVCMQILLHRRNLRLTFDSVRVSFATLYGLAWKADKALRDVDKMRRTLEVVLAGRAVVGQDLKADIADLLQVCFALLESTSSDLRTCMDEMERILDKTRSVSLLGWFYFLPRSSYLISFKNPALSNRREEFPVYAPQILAFLRRERVLPQLLDLTGYPSPQLPSSNHLIPWSDRETRRELQPLCLLLDLLDAKPADVGPLLQPSSTGQRDGHRRAVPLPLLPLHPWQGPFCTLVSIVEDIKEEGCEITPLLELVSTLKQLAAYTFEQPLLSQIVNGFLPRAQLRLGSQLVVVRVLHDVLAWERETSLCPFSAADIASLVLSVKYSLSQEESLQTAEHALKLVFSPDDPNEADNIEDRVPIQRLRAAAQPEASQFQGIYLRARALYEYVMDRRLQ